VRLNEVLGALVLENRNGRPFGQSALAAAEVLAAQAAAALGGAREHQERLAALQSVMNPHFLFNALNSVAELSVTHPAEVEQAVLRLSALYRSILDAGRQNAITLKRELDLVESYLALEKMRFGSRITYHVETTGDAASALVPPLVVQPLVENAVNHGIARSAAGGQVRVTASIGPARVHIRVVNSAPAGSGAAQSEGMGIAMKTLRHRLELLFGAETDLTMTTGDEITVDLFFPFRAGTARAAA
jgi:two-component system sensor histidine kinase AlgZ